MNKLFKSAYLIIILSVLILLFSAEDEKIIIGGTGASQELLKKLAQAYMEKNNNVKIEIPDSIGSSGGIKAVMGDKIDIARIARPLKEEEKATGLTYKIFAISPIVFATSSDIKISNIQVADLVSIYTGKIKNWKKLGGPDMEITVLAREEGDNSRTTIETAIPEFRSIKYKEDFTVLLFDADMIKKLQVIKGGIGYGALINMKLKNLNIMNINKLTSDAKSYLLRSDFAFAYFENKLKLPAKKFIAFIFSDAGKKIISDNFCLPARY